MRKGKIALVITGVVIALVGLAIAAGGSTLIWAHATQRDAGGFYNTPNAAVDTATYALTSNVDFGSRPSQRDWIPTHPVGTARVEVTSTTGTPVFVGIGPRDDVDRWLAGVAHDHVSDLRWNPFRISTKPAAGTHAPMAPATQTFWVASTSGSGTQTLTWLSETGRWSLVVMNADGSRGVGVDVRVGAKTGWLLPAGIGLDAFAMVMLGVAALLLFLGLRREPAEAAGAAPFAPVPLAVAEGSYPVRLDGRVDAPLNRWLWLFKWLFVIPHAIVLAFLWIGVFLLTIVAGFSILFTGRYPRWIFDFNVGVMRWTWRVSFYAVGAFGTDRYPPFSLQPDPEFPADLEVDYPERLSRWQVLVKWWLFAIPHYLIVAAFAGGAGAAFRNGPLRLGGALGLIGLLAVIAAVTVAVRGEYPASIFEFIMGMNRWCYRVAAYATLMRDEYPPFRFDSGGTDPGHVPLVPPPAAPDRSGELVGAGR